MSDNLRSKMIRLAASMPKGSSERKALLDVLAGGQIKRVAKKLGEMLEREFPIKPVTVSVAGPGPYGSDYEIRIRLGFNFNKREDWPGHNAYDRWLDAAARKVGLSPTKDPWTYLLGDEKVYIDLAALGGEGAIVFRGSGTEWD